MLLIDLFCSLVILLNTDLLLLEPSFLQLELSVTHCSPFSETSCLMQTTFSESFLLRELLLVALLLLRQLDLKCKLPLETPLLVAELLLEAILQMHHSSIFLSSQQKNNPSNSFLNYSSIYMLHLLPRTLSIRLLV